MLSLGLTAACGRGSNPLPASMNCSRSHKLALYRGIYLASVKQPANPPAYSVVATSSFARRLLNRRSNYGLLVCRCFRRSGMPSARSSPEWSCSCSYWCGALRYSAVVPLFCTVLPSGRLVACSALAGHPPHRQAGTWHGAPHAAYDEQ